MLSLSDPPLKTHERASLKKDPHLLNPNTPDLHHLNHTFSIRDYVFTARHKDIEKNWPFSDHYLQLCSKHGVKDVLPPFQPPDSVRKQCLSDERKSIGEERYSGEAPTPLHISLCGEINRSSPSPVIKDAQSEREYSVPNNKLGCSVQEASNTWSESSLDLQPPFPSQKNEIAIGKKCRLILKLGPISDTTRLEDISSNATTISDSMASKVCPVCKTFSSTSNTTLNAHIDQCLAVESTSKWVMNDTKPTRHRVKPRKMRSMVDIIATAPRCTLEDLDKRNGSNWAADSSLVTAEAKASAVEKRLQSLSALHLEDTGDESPVYFDSNGTKLRILSKFCEASSSREGDGCRPRKLIKNGKSKIISFDKEKHFGVKHSKRLKPKPRNKKLCSLKLNGAQISGEQEMKQGMGKSIEKVESLSQLLTVRDEINCSESGTLRQWVCSKRTGLVRRFSGKDAPQGLDPSMTKNSSVERNKLNLGDSSLGGNFMHSNPSENVNFSPRRKYVDSPLHGAWVTDTEVESYKGPESRSNPLTNEGTSSRLGGCMLKLPKYSGTCAFSPRSKRIEVHVGPSENLHNSPKTIGLSETCSQMSMKGKQPSALAKELVGRPLSSDFKSKVNDKRSSLKKPRMHRSIAEMDKQVGALSSNVEEQYHCVHNSAENLRGGFNQIEEFGKSDGSGSTLRSGVEEITDQLSFGGAGEGEASSIKERMKPMGMVTPLSGPEIRGLDVEATVNSHARVPFQQFHSSHSSTGKIGGLETGAEEAPFDADTVSKSFSNTIIVSEVSSRVEEISSSEGQRTRFETDPSPKTGPPRSLLPSLGEMNYEDLQENSSLTSSKIPSSQDQHMIVDRDSSGSPVSATSTISYPTMERSDLKYSKVDSCVIPSTVQDKFISGFSGGSTEPILEDATASPFMVSAEGVERIILDGESFRATTISPKGSVKFTDDQSCCCSWKKGLSFGAALTYQDSQLLKRTMASSVIPAKGKQMAYKTNSRPQILVEPDSLQVSRKSEMVVPVLESPKCSFSIPASPDIEQKIRSPYDLSPGRPFSQVHDGQSTSIPVLRLMGKNLMVVNKDEDVSVKHRQPPPGSSNNCASTKYVNPLGYSTGNVSNQDGVSSYPTIPEGSVVFNQDSSNPMQHFFEGDHSKGYRSHSISKAQQRPPQLLAGKHNSMDMGGVTDSSLLWHGFKGRADLQTQPKKHINRLDSFAYKMERGVAQTSQYFNPVSAVRMVGNPSREVIVIDDSPENEAEPSTMDAKNRDGLNGSQPSPVGVLPSTATYPTLRQMSAFSCHTSSNPFSRVEPPVGPKSSFSVSCPRGTNITAAKWEGTSEGPGVPLRNSFTSASSSTCHLSQAMYFSPSFP